MCADIPLSRPRYYTGQLLTAADFQAEQDYLREKMRRHNLCVLGIGVVAGLNVTVDADSGNANVLAITISPGCAIDAHGEEISVCEPMQYKHAVVVEAVYVSLRKIEVPADPAPIAGGGTEFSRILETTAVEISEDIPGNGVVIARVARIGGRWVIEARTGEKPR